MSTEAELAKAERALWLSVIGQAITDAIGTNESHRYYARMWLRQSSEHFRHVCELAGVEPYDVLRLTTKMIAEADAQRPITTEQTIKKARLYKHDGRELTLRQWSRCVGLSYNVLHTRIRNGWTIKRALTTPKYIKGGGRVETLGHALGTGVGAQRKVEQSQNFFAESKS